MCHGGQMKDVDKALLVREDRRRQPMKSGGDGIMNVVKRLKTGDPATIFYFWLLHIFMKSFYVFDSVRVVLPRLLFKHIVLAIIEALL